MTPAQLKQQTLLRARHSTKPLWDHEKSKVWAAGPSGPDSSGDLEFHSSQSGQTTTLMAQAPGVAARPALMQNAILLEWTTSLC